MNRHLVFPYSFIPLPDAQAMLWISLTYTQLLLWAPAQSSREIKKWKTHTGPWKSIFLHPTSLFEVHLELISPLLRTRKRKPEMQGFFLSTLKCKESLPALVAEVNYNSGSIFLPLLIMAVFLAGTARRLNILETV